MGFLYIVQNKGRTKIGRTENLQRRMRELKPDKVWQVVELPENKELERELHRRFADKRLHGSEYFSLNRAERRTACTVAARDGQIVPIYQIPSQAKPHWVSPGVALGLCGLSFAVGVAAVLITQPRPDGQPREAPVSFAAPTKSVVSV